MTSRQETGTSPLVPLAEDQTSVSEAEGQRTSPTLSQDLRLPPENLSEDQNSVVLSYTPSSTPLRPYRFSDHIHQDRHIFLKGATLGIGCGASSEASHAAGFPDWPCRSGGGSSLREQDCFVDDQGNVFCHGHYLGMALNDERLPALHRVQLALPSADWSRQRAHERFPHVHPQHRPPPLRRRRFNEQLNTYVDTQKRIRSVQCLDDLYRSSPFPVFPYLSTPTSRRPRPPPAPPAKIRVLAPPDPPLTLTRQPPAVKSPGRPLGKAAVADSSNNNNVNLLSPGAPDPDVELARARHMMHELQKVSVNQNYADYFLAKEGRQGTLGRLFESYPKRILVHPARLLRQRTDIVSRARLNMLK